MGCIAKKWSLEHQSADRKVKRANKRVRDQETISVHEITLISLPRMLEIYLNEATQSKKRKPQHQRYEVTKGKIKTNNSKITNHVKKRKTCANRVKMRRINESAMIYIGRTVMLEDFSKRVMLQGTKRQVQGRSVSIASNSQELMQRQLC